MKRKVYCFDFDGTLTTKDTLLQFIRFAVGDRAFLAGFLRYSPLLVLMKLRLYPNWKAKQKVFSHFFAGIPVSEFDAVCRDFAEDNRSLLRPAAMAEMERAEAEGAEVYVVSASIDNWVRPFFHSATGGSHRWSADRAFSHRQLLRAGESDPPAKGAHGAAHTLLYYSLRRQPGRQRDVGLCR